MYSPDIIDRRLYLAKKQGEVFQRLPRDKSIDIAQKLERLRFGRDGKALPDGHLIRPLNAAEQAHIYSERLISKCDFEYWFTRFCALELDPGVCDRSGVGAPILLESQRRYITLFGRREKECHAEQAKYKFTEGILAYVHKCRQVVATATVRGISQHRLLFWPGTRGFAASLDDERKGELFKRDHLILDNLPFWMKPKVYPDVKDTELGFEPPVASRISYQAENQQSGIGVGTQNDVSHLTEVALWQYPGGIRYSFVPSIPKAITTFHVQESTSDGKGNYWHEVTEAARHKRRGYESWVYAFIPYYMNRLKYRSNPPNEWTPAEHTLRHAELIERTSPEFFDGMTVRPSREQLWWWESTRAQHALNGELATFLTNYPATPEQSFQSPSQGALPVELIEQMETECRNPEHYDVDVAA
jgi:hypothetical protein